MLLLRETRLEIVKHLFRTAPHNWAKRRALESMIRDVRKTLGSAHPVLKDLEKDYLVNVEALLQRQLSLHVWISRYFVKKREEGPGSGTEGGP